MLSWYYLNYSLCISWEVSLLKQIKNFNSIWNKWIQKILWLAKCKPWWIPWKVLLWTFHIWTQCFYSHLFWNYEQLFNCGKLAFYRHELGLYQAHHHHHQKALKVDKVYHLQVLKFQQMVQMFGKLTLNCSSLEAKLLPDQMATCKFKFSLLNNVEMGTYSELHLILGLA